MSYHNIISFYLVNNKDFDNQNTNLYSYISDNRYMKSDLQFFSPHKDWLTEAFAEILKKSNMQYELLSFLDYNHAEEDYYNSKFFIVEPQKIDDFTNKLEILVNWMLQQDDSYIHNKGEAYQMLSTVQFENYDANMCESPYYCLLVLKLMALFASKNAKFIVIHAWVN